MDAIAFFAELNNSFWQPILLAHFTCMIASFLCSPKQVGVEAVMLVGVVLTAACLTVIGLGGGVAAGDSCDLAIGVIWCVSTVMWGVATVIAIGKWQRETGDESNEPPSCSTGGG